VFTDGPLENGRDHRAHGYQKHFQPERKGHEFARKMAESVLDELPRPAPLVERVVMAVCQNPKAESMAADSAVESLETAFNNSTIQDCQQTLDEEDRDWASLLRL